MGKINKNNFAAKVQFLVRVSYIQIIISKCLQQERSDNFAYSA